MNLNRGAVGMAARGEDCTACGVGCGGGGPGAMTYVGPGAGDYKQDGSYSYVGYGGDFAMVRPRRDFTCLIVSGVGAFLLLPLLLWLLAGTPTTTPPYECYSGVNWARVWSKQQQEYCCETVGVGCAPVLAYDPPKALSVVPAGGDPHNCAIGAESTWAPEKKNWCCRAHHKGCPPTAAPQPQPMPISPQPVPLPAGPEPYDCAAGAANWVIGWSEPKKAYCCRAHGKGCAMTAQYDCSAGFWNWALGWSPEKKRWCCQNERKGC